MNEMQEKKTIHFVLLCFLYPLSVDYFFNWLQSWLKFWLLFFQFGESVGERKKIARGGPELIIISYNPSHLQALSDTLTADDI